MLSATQDLSVFSLGKDLHGVDVEEIEKRYSQVFHVLLLSIRSPIVSYLQPWHLTVLLV